MPLFYVEGDDAMPYSPRTSCTIHDKVCRIIIDFGACANVIASETVEKLCLVIEDHPAPYDLMWLQRGNTIIIAKHVLVSFSIGGTYADIVWCDVVPMDACYLLLGHPWQFDRHVTHDGHRNTYSFMFGGMKIVLYPFTSPSPPPANPPKVLFLSHVAFHKEIEHAPFVLLLLSHDSTDGSTPPEAMQPHLHEFVDLFLGEAPTGLPLLRGIQHHIDLIPSDPVPKFPHYHMSPIEHEELRCQVEELLNRGYI